jgi:hypothetical protein
MAAMHNLIHKFGTSLVVPLPFTFVFFEFFNGELNNPGVFQHLPFYCFDRVKSPGNAMVPSNKRETRRREPPVPFSHAFFFFLANHLWGPPLA